MRRTRSTWIWAALAMSTCGAAGGQPAAAGERPAAVPWYMAYVPQLEATYDYEAYKATAAPERHNTEFFKAIARLLEPQRYVSHSNTVLRRDEAYTLVMQQRAAIHIAKREKWVLLVPSLLHYLDYAESGLAALPIARLWGKPWQYPSMVDEAILSFGSDALPFLERAALEKRLGPELRLAALALMAEIDQKDAQRIGRRLQGDAFISPRRLSGVLQGSITAADIAYSLAYPPKPKPQP